MTAKIKKFIDKNDFYSLVSAYTNVNGVWLNPFNYMKTHNGTTLGLQELSIQGTLYAEVAFANLDETASIGKYTVDPTTNSVILIVDKLVVDTDEKAENLIQGVLLVYDADNMEYYSTDSLYTMETYSADGTFIGSTEASSTGTLVSRMNVLDSDLNINSASGYYYHIYRRALRAS
jgi:hypothetical protein